MTKPSPWGMGTVLLLAVACAATGCGLPLKWKALADKLPQATANNPVIEVLCIWEPAEGRGADGLPTRGFAGQVMFFTRQAASPVRAEGDVRVYVFDNHGTPEEQSKPLHQYDFLGDAWQVHLHDGNLGPTYNVFVPYPRKGNHQAYCGVRVRFTPKHGSVLFSDAVSVVLPGSIPQGDLDPAPNLSPDPKSQPTMKTLAIPMPELGRSQIRRTIAPVSQLSHAIHEEVLSGQHVPRIQATASPATLPVGQPPQPATALPDASPQTPHVLRHPLTAEGP